MTMENSSTPPPTPSAGKNADGHRRPPGAFASNDTFIGSPSYSNGVLTLSIPKDAVKARYAFLQRLVLDIDATKRLADMLALMEDNQSLEELSVPAVGASIHALADRSLDRILSGLCEEYSLATDCDNESAKKDSEVAESLSALLDNNPEDLLVLAKMIVRLARETNELLDQPVGGAE